MNHYRRWLLVGDHAVRIYFHQPVQGRYQNRSIRHDGAVPGSGARTGSHSVALIKNAPIDSYVLTIQQIIQLLFRGPDDPEIAGQPYVSILIREKIKHGSSRQSTFRTQASDYTIPEPEQTGLGRNP